MKLISVAYYEFLKHIRDIRMAAALLLFPLVTIYLLGNVVGNFFTEDISHRIPFGYVNEDSGILGEQFDLFLENENIQDRMDITVYNDVTSAEIAVEEGVIDGFIYIPGTLSEKIVQGEAQEITVTGKRNVEFIESLTSGFISSFNSTQAVMSLSGVPNDSQLEKSSIERITFTNATMPSMIDYYSVLTLLQVLLFGGMFGVFIVSKATDTDLHIRVHSLPINWWVLPVGRVAGSVGYLFLAAVIVLLTTKFIYQANWDGNILIVLGTLLVFCAIAVGIGMLVGTFVQSISTSLMIILLLMMFFSTVSGAISPATTGNLGYISPNFHAKVLLFGTIYSYSKEVMITSALWMMAFFLGVYSLVGLFIWREEKHGHI